VDRRDDPEPDDHPSPPDVPPPGASSEPATGGSGGPSWPPPTGQPWGAPPDQWPTPSGPSWGPAGPGWGSTPPAGGAWGGPPVSGGPPAGGGPPGPTGPWGPPPGAWGPRPKPRTLGYGAFLGRAATVAALVPLVAAFTILALVLALGIGISAIVAVQPDDPEIPTEYVFGDEGDADTILAVPIEGVILDEGTPGGFGGVTYGYAVRDVLADAADDDDIDGVVLEVASPGGTINGSWAIADAVREYQDATGNPVVVFVRGLAASGGVLAAAPATEILADNGSLVGSIGVIFGPFRYYDTPTEIEEPFFQGGVVTQGGIEVRYITAGDGKDFGNPFRRLTQEEIDVVQGGVNAEYDRFVDLVATERDMARETIVDDMGALLYGTDQALEFGLIDGVADRNAAYRRTAELSGIAGDFQVVRWDPPTGFIGSLLGGQVEVRFGEQTGDDPGLPEADLCGLTSAMLAYQGDPTLLCQPR
jgi:protease IV